MRVGRWWRLAVAVLAVGAPAARAGAQAGDHAAADTLARHPIAAPRTALPRPLSRRTYYARLGLGFASSLLLHESGHVGASYAVGARPSFGVDRGRPTVYSGIDAGAEPHRQLVFSSAGLVLQAVADEAILDVPHASRGSAFERGALLGGIATAFFYTTLGRNASVSDVTYIARTSGWSKTRVSLVVGGVAALHTWRVARDRRYARFWRGPRAAPSATAATGPASTAPPAPR